MPSHVRVVRGTKTVAERVIPGPVYPMALPPEASVLWQAPSADGETALEIVLPTDVDIAGRLAIPFGGYDGLEVAYLDVPSSGVFSQADCPVMWQAASRLRRWRSRPAVPGADLEPFAGARLDSPDGSLRLVWEAARPLAEQAAELLRGWPMQDDRTELWGPVGLARGVEDLGLTEARLTAVEAEAHAIGDTVRLTRSVRVEGALVPWQSDRVSDAARLVIRTARAVSEAHKAWPSEGRDALHRLLAPIHRTGEAAHTGRGGVQEDLSSLPPRFQHFVRLAMIATGRLAAVLGDSFVPLLKTQDLYEQWLADVAVTCFEAVLGAPDDPPADAPRSLLARWTRKGATIDLHYKPVIPSDRTGRRLGHRRLVATLSDRLEPDLLVAIDDSVESRIRIYDAKAWSMMEPGNVAEQAGKYLWAIRSSDAAAVPGVVDEVVLVTSCAPPTPGWPEGRARVIQIQPSGDQAHLRFYGDLESLIAPYVI